MNVTEQQAVKTNPVLTPKRGLTKNEVENLPYGKTLILKDPSNKRRQYRRFKNKQSGFIKPKKYAFEQLNEQFLSLLKGKFNEKLGVR